MPLPLAIAEILSSPQAPGIIKGLGKNQEQAWLSPQVRPWMYCRWTCQHQHLRCRNVERRFDPAEVQAARAETSIISISPPTAFAPEGASIGWHCLPRHPNADRLRRHCPDSGIRRLQPIGPAVRRNRQGRGLRVVRTPTTDKCRRTSACVSRSSRFRRRKCCEGAAAQRGAGGSAIVTLPLCRGRKV